MQYDSALSQGDKFAMTLPSLDNLGHRIMICGTSNTGKSTLAVALGDRLGVPVIHLDQFRFQPHTDWVERPDEEFAALHREAIRGDTWIIEGNYTRIMPERLARATGIVLLGDSRWANFARYLRRTLLQPDSRLGNLEGNRDSLKWSMVHWVLVQGPRNIARYRTDLPASGLPFLECRSMRALKRLYLEWGLTRPNQ